MARNETQMNDKSIIIVQEEVVQLFSTKKILKSAKKQGYTRVTLVAFTDDGEMHVCSTNRSVADTNADLDQAKHYILHKTS
jgi:hypothetical protein